MDCSTKDSVWIVGISSSIVFQGIVLALFQSAVTRWKCVHTALLQAFLCMVSGSILWYSVGFSLSFGRSQKGFIGDLDNAFFIQVSHINSSSNAPTISSMALATFEVVLASIGPVMVITTWCQQVAVLGSLIVFLLWPLLVYYPITHWARGGGWLEDMGLVDQGGSLTLHVSAGTSALVFTRMLRPYISSRSTDETRNHHDASQEATLLLVGVLMIWGWFAINIGSGYRMDGTIALSAFNTYMSANVSAMCWFVVVYITRRTVSFVDLMSGVIAGIVGCSACSGSIESWASILTGFLVGSTSSAIQCCVRNHFPWWTNGSKFDVTYIHGIPGIVGALMAGLTTKSSLGGAVNNGAFYSNSKQLGVQMLGVLMCVVWPLLWTYFITWFVHFTVGFSLNSAVVVEESFYSDQVLAQVHPCHVIDAAQIFQAASDGDDRQLEALSHKPGVSFNFKNFDRRTPLHEAASRGHLECVKFLLRQPGVDIHSRDRWKNTSLSEAIRFGHDHVVHCLIRHGASWEEDGAGNILCTAVARNDIDELRRLLSLGVEANTSNADGRTALHLAAILGSRGLIQYLIDQGADINAVDSYGNASLNYSDMHEHRAVSQLLESLGAKRLSHHYSTHEICEAASTGNLQMLRHMVHNGAVISYRDTNKRTPLHVSAAEGYLDVVKFLLLQPGIDINARDRDNVTPLLEAVIHEHDLVAEHLKSHGGGIAEGKLAELMNNSARSGDVRNLKRFVRWLGHVNICDNDGSTPLHTAVQHDRVTMVTMLLKEGADCHLVDRYGKTPLQVACSRHHGAIENELRKYVQPQAHSRITDAPENFLLHHRANRKRRRKCRTGPSSYAYSKRESWSSGSDNSTEIHKTSPKNAVNKPRTNGTTKSDNELNEISNCKPPFFRGTPISSLTPKAREMTGGQPDYV